MKETKIVGRSKTGTDKKLSKKDFYKISKGTLKIKHKK